MGSLIKNEKGSLRLSVYTEGPACKCGSNFVSQGLEFLYVF